MMHDHQVTEPDGTWAVVVSGVSGAGKTTVADALADTADASFIDADDLHPDENVEKMRHGIPLNDDDRSPWLSAVAEAISTELAAGRSVVVACSAMKRRYRDQLRAGTPQLMMVQLITSAEVLRARVEQRPDHFMPASLLESQLATLEPLGDDERGLILDAAMPVAEISRCVFAALESGEASISTDA